VRPTGFEPVCLLAHLEGDQKRGRLTSTDSAVPVLDQAVQAFIVGLLDYGRNHETRALQRRIKP
jgi:hypothetical protein